MLGKMQGEQFFAETIITQQGAGSLQQACSLLAKAVLII